MSANVNDISGFDAMTEEIRYVYAERDRLRDEVEALRQFKKDICEVLCIGGNSHNDGIVKLLKANKERTRMEDDDNRMYRDILDELKTYFKMTAPHWKYSDVPHFVKCSHEFAIEKREDAEEQAKQLTEDICAALWVRPDMSTRDSILEEISKLRDMRENHKRTIKKQEEFTEEAASILGVNLNDLSLSDVLAALRKLKRYEELNNMNCEIIADLKTERDNLQKDYLNEIGRRKTAERYISDTFERISKALDLGHIPDSIDSICDEIAVLRNREFYQSSLWNRMFWESMCGVMEMDPADATPSDVLAMIGEAKKRLISILALNPDTATWTDIYEAIKAEQKDHCDLISKSYKMKNELADLKVKCDEETGRRIEAEEYAQTASNNLEKICVALGIECSTDTTIEYILDTIDDLRSKEGTYCHQSFVFRSVCDYLCIASDDATLSDIHKEIEKLKSWKTVAEDHGKRRRNWVRKYKSEHERANSCDELYKKYKALYDADAPARKKLSDDIETYRASYEAVKNVATKNRSLMNTVAQIVGTVGMHDDVTMAAVQNAKKKANHWDILVDSYGEGTIRSLLDNIGIDVSGDKGNGLFR